MNVSIIVKEFPPDIIGGTETQTMRMASKLQQSTDHSITIYTKAYSSEESYDSDLDIVRVPNWRINSFTSTLTFTIMALIYVLRDSRRIDVLQCMMVYPPGFIGYIVSKLTGVPYFAWIRGGDYYFMKENRVKRWMIGRVLRDTRVLVQTEAVREDVLREFPAANLEVLGNGVTIPDETAAGDDVVFVGRLKRQKGVHVLLEAMEEIDKRLLIVGDGPERDRLEALAEKFNVDVEFVGEVDPEAVEEYLKEGSVFVLPSVTGEGLPNAVLEAMAVGLPVIGTDTGGVRNAIIEGETGYVVEPGDSESLRERLERLTTDSTLQNQLGVAAREYVEMNHSWAHLCEQLDNLYQEMVDDDDTKLRGLAEERHTSDRSRI